MQVLDIGGKKWMVGIEWEILPGDATIKLESKEVAEKTNSTYGVVIDYDSIYAIGLTKKVSKEPSAALYLALANQQRRDNESSNDYPDWIVLEEVSDDKYWMGVVKSGIPAPQFDAILSITEIKERITELLINDTYTVFTSAGEIVSIFEGIKEIEKMGLNEITAEVKSKVKFIKLLGVPQVVIYTGVAILVLAVSSYFIVKQIEGNNLSEKIRTIKAQQQQEKIIKQQLYQTNLKKYEQDKIKAKIEQKDLVVSGLSGNPAKILSAFYDNVGGSDMGTHGWKMTKIECYFEPTASIPPSPSASPNQLYPRLACDYLYERTSLSTTRMLLEDFPNSKLNGDKAVVSKQVEIDPVFIEKANPSIFDMIKTSKNWGFDVQSQLQLLKVVDIDHEITGSKEIMYSVNGKPISPEEQEAGKQANPPEVNSFGVGVGEIIIKGSNFDMVKELADNVDFSGTGFRKVTFNVRELGQIAWEAKFNYYVKTENGGIGASTTVTQTPAEIQQQSGKLLPQPGK